MNMTEQIPTISEVKINELKSLDTSLKVLAQLIEIFKNEARDRVLEMQQCAASHDYVRLAQVTHRFKSTAYNLGANRAAQIVLKIETLIAGNSVSQQELNQLLSVLKTECEAAAKTLNNYLP